MTGNLFESGTGTGKVGAEWITAHCDGGSRGNPGPAGYGVLITDAGGKVLTRLSEFLGVQTNNFAEYKGLLAALKWALEHGKTRLRVVSDSELMVKQIKGQFKVSSPGLRPLWEEAKGLARKLDGFEMSHTLRGGNKEADKLANEAMDSGTASQRASGSASQRANAYEKPPAAGQASRSASQRADKSASAPKEPRQVIEGYVKDGVVHLLEGELPDGIFVKVVRE